MQKLPHNHNRLSINNSQQSPPVFLYTQSTLPPAQRIIASKDDAIQQLIIQNTHLKRQLSQLMLKTSTQPTPLQTALQSPQHYITLQSSKQHTAIQSPKYNTIQSSIQSGLQSPIQNGNIIRPNTIQFNSMLRSSLENTMKSNFYNKNIKNTTNVTHTTNNSSFHNYNNASTEGINNNGMATIRQTPTSPINRGHLVHPHHSPPNHYSPSHNQPNIPSRKQNRSYRHSIDMCTNLQPAYNNYLQYNQQSVNISIHNKSNSNQQKNHNHKVQYSLTSQQYYQPKVNNYNNNDYRNNNNKYRNNNNTIVIPEIRMQPLSNQVNDHIMQQDQLIQQQLYRQKMMKLKNKKSPRSRQLSQQNKSKQFSQQKYNHNTQQQYNHANYVNRTNGDNSNNKNKLNKNNIRDVRKQQLMKAHQILKAKLNNNNNSNNNNSNRYQQQNNTKITKYNNQYLSSQKQKQQQPKQQLSTTSFQAQSKSPIKKLISTQDIKLIQQVKKLPKYIPKSFSKSKLSTQQQQQNMQINKMDINKDNNKVDNYPIVKSKKSIQPNKQFTIIETTLRLKTQPKQLKQSNSVKQSNSIKQKNKQKKICLSQLKGRVYLDDQNQQKQKTKRTINHKHITQMNHNLAQLTNRPTPQQTPNSIKKLSTDQSVSNINNTINKTDDDRLIMMRKNSNKIYLQEDQDNKSKNKQNTNSSNCNNNQGFNKIIVQGNNTVNTNRRQQVHHDIVSIQEIHMISDQDNIKNINNNNIQPTPISKPSLKQQKQPSQQQSSIINKALSIKSPSSSQQQRKQLYNHIYCQQSKTKFK